MISFIGAGCGDVELLTIKAKKIISNAEVILYTGSLVPKEIFSWNTKAITKNSHNLTYDEIFDFLLKYKDKKFVRLHTGDPSLYSTIAKQIEFLKLNNIPFEIIPGVTSAFCAASSLGIEYTIPGISQTLILTRIEGKTPQPEKLKDILRLKHSSFVFYLSINLIDKLINTALELNYDINTPCYVVYKASYKDEQTFKGTLKDIKQKTSHLKGISLILFGDFLYQKEKHSSILYKK